jgi:hypothetical protein
MKNLTRWMLAVLALAGVHNAIAQSQSQSSFTSSHQATTPAVPSAEPAGGSGGLFP